MRRARALSPPMPSADPSFRSSTASSASKFGDGAPVTAPQPGVTWTNLWGELRRSQQLDCVVPACALSLLLSASELVSPLIRGQLFDAVLQPGTTFGMLWPRLRLLAAVALFGWITSIAVGVLFARARWQFCMSTRVRLMDAMLRQEPAFYDAQAPGELASRLNTEPERLQELANRGPERALNALLGVCGGAALMTYTEPRLALAAVLLKAPLLSQIAVLAGRTVGLLGALQQSTLNRANALAAEALAQPQTVASLGARQAVLKEYGVRIGEYLKVIEQTLLTETVCSHVSCLCGARQTAPARET
jgi:ABC-type multidrug transport system fused ATPase/permease subunit